MNAPSPLSGGAHREREGMKYPRNPIGVGCMVFAA